jgi:phosphatidylglycerophosphate synthase
MKNKIPLLLIYSRLIIGLAVVALSLLGIKGYNIIAVVLFSIGLLTDIFDGIIARRLHISTQNLRRLDSTIDQIFFLSILAATFIQCPDFFYRNSLKLFILLGIEASTYVICFLKFRKEIATHALSSKAWTLILFATLIQIMIGCDSGILFQICFYTGILTRLEIIGIILLIRNWTNDVPTIYHAWLLRKGKSIKRNKLFNG